MFALVKREIRDHVIYIIVAAALSAILIIALITIAYHEGPQTAKWIPEEPIIPFFALTMLGFCAMGVSQMYMDRTRRISAFVSTLSVTRTHILLARIITGTLTILVLFVPLIVTLVILLRIFSPSIPMYAGILFDISTTALLMTFACYCLGLLTGWSPNKVTPTLGALLLTCVLVPLVIIKGFGWEIAVILFIFISASLIRTWQAFTSQSL